MRPAHSDPTNEYQRWYLRDLLTPAAYAEQQAAARSLDHRPLVSVLTPVFNTSPEAFRRMLASVRLQTYPNWQHCLVDDASTEPWIWHQLQLTASRDSRVTIVRRDHNGGIVAASNDALSLARGELVALLDHDDELAPDALFEVVRAFTAAPETQLVYTDLDIIGEDGRHHSPILKPAWSPDALLSSNYLAHLNVYRRSTLLSAGGFRPGLDGAQDYDLALRVTSKTSAVAHLPRILYHWRVSPTSVASGLEAKPYAHDAGRKAVEDHLKAQRLSARRLDGAPAGYHMVRWSLARTPLVSVIRLPRMGRCGAKAMVEQDRSPLGQMLATARYAETEVIETLPSPRLQETLDLGEWLHMAVTRSSGEWIVFLGADVVQGDDEWLHALVEWLDRPAIGIVGGKVVTAEKTVRSAGIVLVDGQPHHYGSGEHERGMGYVAMLQSIRNYSAVSIDCMAVRRAVLDEVGGFHPAAEVGLPGVDLCLRARSRGYRVVFTPASIVREAPVSYGAQPRKPVEAQQAAFARTWPHAARGDPFFNAAIARINPSPMLDSAVRA